MFRDVFQFNENYNLVQNHIAVYECNRENTFAFKFCI
jgi:hypothetical protein